MANANKSSQKPNKSKTIKSKSIVQKQQPKTEVESVSVEETPVKTEETPVKTKEETPVKTKEETPVKTKEETPVKTEEETPVKIEETEDTTTSSDSGESKKSKTESASSDSIENAFITKLNIFTSKVAAINREVRELQSIGKTLEKDFNQVIKVISKQKNKNKNNENRTLSGFAMPSLLSEELYRFLKIEEGTRIPRKDVTKMLNDYIKENKLRDEKDKRRILPDESLKKIFNCTEQDNVTYFNLQTYMKHHFIKDQKPFDRPVSV